MAVTILAKLAPYLWTGEKTSGVPGFLVILAIIFLVYWIVKNNKKGGSRKWMDLD